MIPHCGTTWPARSDAREGARSVVQRVNEVNIARCEQLMLDEDGGGCGFLLQDTEREWNEFVAVALRKIRDGADEARSGTAQLSARFPQRILPHDGYLLRRACFIECAQSRERADVVDRAHEGASGNASAQIFAHDLKHLLKAAAAVEMHERRFHNARQLVAKAVDQAGETQLKKRAGDGQFNKYQLIDFAILVFARPAA
jgi:hypothetical protein